MRRVMLCLVLSACVVDELEHSEVGDEIHGPNDTLAQTSAVERAALMLRVSNDVFNAVCTGTLVNRTHVITAAHCLPINEVWFYTLASRVDNTRRRQVVRTSVPPGVFALAGDFTDSSGRLADIAVLEIEPADSGAVSATMAWTYPGAGATGVAVGAGVHDGVVNDDVPLRQMQDVTMSSSDDNGRILITTTNVDNGDSGGPLYTSTLRAFGVLKGFTHDVAGIPRAGYTSIPEQLPWILDAMNFDWLGGPYITRYRGGTSLQTFIAPRAVCEYACKKQVLCDAVNFLPAISACQLVGDVTSSTSSSAWVSAYK